MKRNYMRHRYYHKRLERALRFIVLPGKKVLFVSLFNNAEQAAASPYHDIGSKEKWEWHSYKNLTLSSAKQFDYIVLDGALGQTDDIPDFLDDVRQVCHPGTRIVVYQHNYLWQGPLSLGEALRLKYREGIFNWLSVGDVKMYLESAGFETTRVFKRTLCPVFLFGIGPLINWIFALIPILDFLKIDQYIIARPRPEILNAKKPESLTICLTVRNERDNIEPIVKSLPRLCENQEILFVEGHSDDGTREEIRRVIEIYPEKNIRVIGQPGKGQGDAIRNGFKDARGDVIILYEGDGTSDTKDLRWFWKAMRIGRFEFIEGSRFVYPFDNRAMPLLKKLGNIFFANWFSFFLGQRTTDVLSGIKAILKEDFLTLEKQWGSLGIFDPFGDFELLFGAAKMGLKFGEIPMRYYPRPYGKSKSRLVSHGIPLLKMAARGYWIFRK